MIIEAFLLFCFLLLSAYAFTQRKKTLLGFFIIFLLSILGALSVLFPNFVTKIANFVGIGRGTDLIFYLFAVSSLALFFKFYLKIQEIDSKITKLARLHAIKDSEK